MFLVVEDTPIEGNRKLFVESSLINVVGSSHNLLFRANRKAFSSSFFTMNFITNVATTPVRIGKALLAFVTPNSAPALAAPAPPVAPVAPVANPPIVGPPPIHNVVNAPNAANVVQAVAGAVLLQNMYTANQQAFIRASILAFPEVQRILQLPMDQRERH